MTQINDKGWVFGVTGQPICSKMHTLRGEDDLKGILGNYCGSS